MRGRSLFGEGDRASRLGYREADPSEDGMSTIKIMQFRAVGSLQYASTSETHGVLDLYTVTEAALALGSHHSF